LAYQVHDENDTYKQVIHRLDCLLDSNKRGEDMETVEIPHNGARYWQQGNSVNEDTECRLERADLL